MIPEGRCELTSGLGAAWCWVKEFGRLLLELESARVSFGLVSVSMSISGIESMSVSGSDTDCNCEGVPGSDSVFMVVSKSGSLALAHTSWHWPGYSQSTKQLCCFIMKRCLRPSSRTW